MNLELVEYRFIISLPGEAKKQCKRRDVLENLEKPTENLVGSTQPKAGNLCTTAARRTLKAYLSYGKTFQRDVEKRNLKLTRLFNF